MIRGRLAWGCVCVAAVLLLASNVANPDEGRDQEAIVYNSIPAPLPPNVASEGPESYAFSEFGDGLALAGGAGHTLDKVTVVMASWACTSGNWFSATCATTPGATYTMPMTLNVYSVITGSSLEGQSPAPSVGTLLATVTQDFSMPYRPSTNSVNCAGGAWYDSRTQTCWNGLAFPITFDLSSFNVTLPGQIIVGVQYNTTDYGPNPVGDSAPCHSTTQGCFYDSLNVSADSNGGFYRSIGAVLDVDGIFVDYTLPDLSCTGAAATGIFGLDASPGCWTGAHPEIQVTVKATGEGGQHHHGRR